MKRYVTVSEMQDFLNCQWRWYAKWILNRVPRKWSTALILGTSVHDVFEWHFSGRANLHSACNLVEADLIMARTSITNPDHAMAVVRAWKDFKKYRPQIEAFTDKFKIDETLEVEIAFEVPLYMPKFAWANWPGTPHEWIFRGRPDRVVRIGNFVYHEQHKTVAANKSVEMYSRLLQRSMHEGVYGHYLSRKYNGELSYGGSIINLVRKGVVKPSVPLEALAFQTMVTVDAVDRERAWARARAIAVEMDRAEYIGRTQGHHALIDNPGQDDGYFHNSLDGYLPVLQGKASLDDDALFMPREETYADVED